MENWQFALWPLWMKYDVAATPHRAVLWPLVTCHPMETHTMWRGCALAWGEVRTAAADAS